MCCLKDLTKFGASLAENEATQNFSFKSLPSSTRKIEDCQAQSQEMGFEFFYDGDFPTKGCYSKGTNAFFSLGSEDERQFPIYPV